MFYLLNALNEKYFSLPVISYFKWTSFISFHCKYEYFKDLPTSSARNRAKII